MTTIFDPSRNVKPAGPACFGRGIVPARRERRAPYTAADAQWWAENSPSNARDYDVIAPAPKPISGGAPEPDWDVLAAESAALDRYERGLCC